MISKIPTHLGFAPSEVSEPDSEVVVVFHVCAEPSGRGLSSRVGADEPKDLSESQLAELHEDLMRLVSEVEELLTASEGSSKAVELDQSTVGRLSRMDALAGQQMSLASRRGLQLRLDQGRQALRRVEEGEFGLCCACGEPVGFRRLKVRPETPFCIRCQGASER